MAMSGRSWALLLLLLPLAAASVQRNDVIAELLPGDRMPRLLLATLDDGPLDVAALPGDALIHVIGTAEVAQDYMYNAHDIRVRMSARRLRPSRHHD